MLKILAVFAGGGVGALLRWLLALKLNPAIGEEPALPLGTLASNMGGGFLIGLLMAAFIVRADWPEEARLLLVTGFLGGLTTFSTFSWEIVHFLAQGRLALGFMNMAVSLVGSLGLTAIGLTLGRLVFKV
jgi:CrcB protein